MIDPLVTAALGRPDAPALKDASRAWTWQELLLDARALGDLLGAVEGRRVALLAMDTGPAVVAIHAVRLAGATLVPLNRRLAPAELLALLTRSGAVVLVHDAAHAQMAAEIAGDIRRVESSGCGLRSRPAGRHATWMRMRQVSWHSPRGPLARPRVCSWPTAR